MKAKRKEKRFRLGDNKAFIKKALRWASHSAYFSYFSPNDYNYLHGPFPHLLAVGATAVLTSPVKGAFDTLQHFHDDTKDWLLGFLSYDLKNDVEILTSDNPATIPFEGLTFFQPETLLFFLKDDVLIQSFLDPAEVFESINLISLAEAERPSLEPLVIENRVDKEKYMETVRQIREKIIDGEVYELNYCIEYFCEADELNPLETFLQLNELSPMPFAAFQRFEDKYLLCASPERFLKKEAHKIISQPIKGTMRRGSNESEDNVLKDQLYHSEKERAENMMIVDLVRNDLARSAVPGSVKVDELFGIYTYPKVHQMVSTVSAHTKPGVAFSEIIRNAFPMGSMTGAPKVSAMKLIEQFESSRRGLFSGAAGYITPNGDFDFNVVIRSILYEQKTKKISFQVGSAITYDAVPEQEYQECQLKAEAMRQVLTTAP